MDDWNWNNKPWKLYVEVGILAFIAIAAAVAYTVSRVVTSN